MSHLSLTDRAVAALLAPTLRTAGLGGWADPLGVVVAFTLVVALHVTLGQLVPASLAAAHPRAHDPRRRRPAWLHTRRPPAHTPLNEVNDLFLVVILLTDYGAGTYLVGHSRGRQAGCNDARQYRDPGSNVGA